MSAKIQLTEDTLPAGRIRENTFASEWELNGSVGSYHIDIKGEMEWCREKH